MGYDFSKVSVMVIDDSYDMRRLLGTVLKGFGFVDVREISDGEAALELLHEWVPDIIVTDWMMPQLDGVEFTRIVRRASNQKIAFIPIILVTGHTEKEKICFARDAGVHEILAKPIIPRSLLDRIISVIDNPRPFIATKTYFGPCRRRRTDARYKGPERRQAAEEDAFLVSPPQRTGTDQ